VTASASVSRLPQSPDSKKWIKFIVNGMMNGMGSVVFRSRINFDKVCYAKREKKEDFYGLKSCGAKAALRRAGKPA
jgi:hypothetical protein